MSGRGLSADQVTAKLTEMGFENSAVVQAVKEVGPSFDDAVDYMYYLQRKSSDCGNCAAASSSSRCITCNGKAVGKRTLSCSPSLRQKRQSSILDHFQSIDRHKRHRANTVPEISFSRPEILAHRVNEHDRFFHSLGCNSLETGPETLPVCCPEQVDIGSDWEQRANSLLQKRFGHPSLKSFQKEALVAWLAHQDCLVLAATGSGKSLCFQIPALLTRQVVVVISPLISLMHDQCSKLSKHGISACFLGSGQPDSSVEQKAITGMYDIIYVCPETVLRLLKPLQRLAERRGIALFAIDEVHCVSKWGHDFRPDYRRLSVLRENFSACNLKFLKYDIPMMALTATATMQVREDIIESLSMSKETKIVLTSFFRTNLGFLVKHSRTSSPCSYEKDFCHLIGLYTRKRKTEEKKQSIISKEPIDWSDGSADAKIPEADGFSPTGLGSIEYDCGDMDDDDDDDDDDEVTLTGENGAIAPEGKEMSIEYLENEVDVFQSEDGWDVAYGEFRGQYPCENQDICVSAETNDPPDKPEERLKLLLEPLEEGPTIIYVPTRKETLSISKYLCDNGVKAAAYNASLPKSHLRQVHKGFHDNMLQVIVATIAFGMGIDKSNVRRIIHYGWPQSLEAYYQEVGRAGRDGKLAECTLYANLSRMPSLLPSKRSEDQTKQAHKMLFDCFRYGMNTSCCRAKILVEYFSEDFCREKCLLCDVCVDGPPKILNLKEEANLLMQVVAAYHVQRTCLDGSYDIYSDTRPQVLAQKANLRMFVGKIREQSQKFSATDQLWWQGIARIMEAKGYIKEGDDKIHVQIKFPEPTKLGLEFLQYDQDQPFLCYPEADMLLSMNRSKSYSSFADWGKGWADPEIRRQRLERKRLKRKPGKKRQPRMRKFIKVKADMRTARDRIAAKLFDGNQ